MSGDGYENDGDDGVIGKRFEAREVVFSRSSSRMEEGGDAHDAQGEWMAVEVFQEAV